MSLANLEQIRQFYKQKLPRSFPFDTHPLVNGTAEQKDLYCTMLTLIGYYENEPTEAQQVFLERIATAAQSGLNKEMLVEKAESIDQTFAQRFYELLVETPLANNFVIDSLLLVYSSEQNPSSEQQSFLLEVINALFISKEQLAALIEVVNECLAVSAENYIDILKQKECM